MQKLSKIHLSLISALALVGCDNVGGGSENSQVRQNKLTISNTPVFPHSGSGDIYALVLSNHTKEDMQLTNSQLKGISPSDEDSADDISTKLQLAKSLKATQLTDLIDLSACKMIKAGANCVVTIELPKQVASGYFDFSLQYTDSNAKAYTVDKLVVFNAGMVANDGVILTNQYIESVVVNSDKYTLAIPFQLTDDFESVAIRQHGVAPTGYNQIICNNQANDGKTNNSRKYAANNSCTALIELDSHEANPELALTFSDTHGSSRTVEIKSSVLYGNYPELVIIGAPAILTNASSKVITIKNIGTQTAKDVRLSETGDTTSFDINKASCEGKSLENNQQCVVQYQAKGNNQTATITQSVSYKGDDGLDTRMFSTKYPVYINKVANLKAPNQNNTTVLPAHRAIDAQKEYFPEELENITVSFDQPVNASGLYMNDGGMGALFGGKYSGCEGYTYLTPDKITCKLKSTDLRDMIGDTIFEMRTAQLGNSTGLIGNKPINERYYYYTVRHHRNPRVSAITNTSQTFKPGNTIKFAINLDSSRYSANNRYRFNPQSGYTITSNNCNTATNGCRIEVEYKIPLANQLTGSGTIQHTLPQQILSIVPASGSKPSELRVVHSQTVSVSKLPATHITDFWITHDFLQGYSCTKMYNTSGAVACYFRVAGISAPGYQSVIRSFNRFNGNSSCLLPVVGLGIGFCLTLNNLPDSSQGEIDPGIFFRNPIRTENGYTTAAVGAAFYVVLIPNGQDIRTNPPGTIYVGRFCIPLFPISSSSTGASVVAPYCGLPPEQ
ncbi:hypothetical protein [Aquella oligotrophica]|uniref:Lipoprotein n=1 Tax=Aquella oligotrophica TaxID=2067065 RepID=A0A2I7N654_9NEIS|nr:hypothetical protein [Aquella oligotrophica]AUR51921.1 hypothetical protein CUN60_06290 [Aquella oligotrophica]